MELATARKINGRGNRLTQRNGLERKYTPCSQDNRLTGQWSQTGVIDTALANMLQDINYWKDCMAPNILPPEKHGEEFEIKKVSAHDYTFEVPKPGKGSMVKVDVTFYFPESGDRITRELMYKLVPTQGPVSFSGRSRKDDWGIEIAAYHHTDNLTGVENTELYDAGIYSSSHFSRTGQNSEVRYLVMNYIKQTAETLVYEIRTKLPETRKKIAEAGDNIELFRSIVDGYLEEHPDNNYGLEEFVGDHDLTVDMNMEELVKILDRFRKARDHGKKLTLDDMPQSLRKELSAKKDEKRELESRLHSIVDAGLQSLAHLHYNGTKSTEDYLALQRQILHDLHANPGSFLIPGSESIDTAALFSDKFGSELQEARYSNRLADAIKNWTMLRMPNITDAPTRDRRLNAVRRVVMDPAKVKELENLHAPVYKYLNDRSLYVLSHGDSHGGHAVYRNRRVVWFDFNKYRLRPWLADETQWINTGLFDIPVTEMEDRLRSIIDYTKAVNGGDFRSITGRKLMEMTLDEMLKIAVLLKYDDDLYHIKNNAIGFLINRPRGMHFERPDPEKGESLDILRLGTKRAQHPISVVRTYQKKLLEDLAYILENGASLGFNRREMSFFNRVEDNLMHAKVRLAGTEIRADLTERF